MSEDALSRAIKHLHRVLGNLEQIDMDQACYEDWKGKLTAMLAQLEHMQRREHLRAVK